MSFCENHVVIFCKLWITYLSSLSPSVPLSSALSGLKRSVVSSTFELPFLNIPKVYQNVRIEKMLAFSLGFSAYFCSLVSMFHALLIERFVVMTADVYQHSIKSLICFVYKLIYFYGYRWCREKDEHQLL